MDLADDFVFAEDYPLQPLDDDCRLLCSLMDDCIKVEHGDSVYNLIERVRALSNSYNTLSGLEQTTSVAGTKTQKRGGSEMKEDTKEIGKDVAAHPVESNAIADLTSGLRERLLEELTTLELEDAITVSRSCGHYLNLSSIAETHHRVRNDHVRSDKYCEDVFQNLIAQGVDPKELFDKVVSQQVEVVLTAHPTQVKRRTLQHKHTRIEALLGVKDMGGISHEEKDQAIEELMREIMTLWHTSELRNRKPTPIDEARGGLHIVEQSLWTALPRYLKRLSLALKKHTGHHLPIECAPIRFASWMGGDRDGNPNVTASVTYNAIHLSRWIAADLYLREIDLLRFELSLSKCNEDLEQMAAAIERDKTDFAQFREQAGHARNNSGSFPTGMMISGSVLAGDASVSHSKSLGAAFPVLGIGNQDVNSMSMVSHHDGLVVHDEPQSPEGGGLLSSASGSTTDIQAAVFGSSGSLRDLGGSSGSLQQLSSPQPKMAKGAKESDKTKTRKNLDSILNPNLKGQTPYRVVLGEVRRRLLNTKALMEELLSGGQDASITGMQEEDYFATEGDLIEILGVCYRSLCDTGAGIVADGRLLDLLRRCHAFGMTLMKLDIRQESGRHKEVLEEVTSYLGIGRYSEWSESDRVDWILKEIQSKRPLIPQVMPRNDKVQECLDTFDMVAKEHASLGAYIISMASTASDVLAVILLQREAGTKVSCDAGEPYDKTKQLRVVPLFETLQDLENGPKVMDRLLSIPWYRNYLREVHGNKIEVMLGYSDSGKDAGRFAAAWALYKAQERLVKVCAEHDVSLTMFHGRGGSIGRGGGPMYLAIQSQPPGSIQGKLRVTEQGEMVQAKFGTGNIALRQMEIVTTAVLRTSLNGGVTEPKHLHMQVMDRLSSVSCDVYREIVFKNPTFLSYFKKATPEGEIGNLNIGSRPSRRNKGSTSVKDLRAIPWIFAWTQNRLVLPAWLGIGEALDKEIAKGNLHVLRDMYANWPFFQSTVDLIEMVLAKADGSIAKAYDDVLVSNEEERSLGVELRKRLDQTAEKILLVSGHEKLCENHRILRHLIDKRRPFLEPINLLQVEILRRLRENPSNIRLREALLITMNGIAAGMRNTG